MEPSTPVRADPLPAGDMSSVESLATDKSDRMDPYRHGLTMLHQENDNPSPIIFFRLRRLQFFHFPLPTRFFDGSL